MKLAFLASLFTVSILACGGDDVSDVVGASCRDDRDCAETCLRGDDYPGGFCSVTCFDDLDCPADSICTDKSGGVCLFPCDLDAHCDFLGVDYACRETDDYEGRRVLVCLGD